MMKKIETLSNKAHQVITPTMQQPPIKMRYELRLHMFLQEMV